MAKKAAEIEQLKQAIQGLHKCSASHVSDVAVHETFEGKPAWEGVVAVFSVDHPEADTCYAWSLPIEGSDQRKFYAVLGKSPIDSARAAVRASIVSDYRENSGP